MFAIALPSTATSPPLNAPRNRDLHNTIGRTNARTRAMAATLFPHPSWSLCGRHLGHRCRRVSRRSRHLRRRHPPHHQTRHLRRRRRPSGAFPWCVTEGGTPPPGCPHADMCTHTNVNMTCWHVCTCWHLLPSRRHAHAHVELLTPPVASSPRPGRCRSRWLKWLRGRTAPHPSRAGGPCQ